MKLRCEKIKAASAGMPMPRRGEFCSAFTLIEMTVVLGLAVIIAIIILPSLRGFGESNTINAATRQMLDDVSYARQTAIKNHSKVYMVFLPPRFWTNLDNAVTSYNTNIQREIKSLSRHQYTSYALFSFHTVGDQPGQKSFRYLTKWRELPEGAIIETNKFFATDTFPDFIDGRTYTVRPFPTMKFPFPPSVLTNAAATTNGFNQCVLPYVAFAPTGALLSDSNDDELIPLAQGSIFYPTDAAGEPDLNQAADVVEKNYREVGRVNYNIIRIDRLTGRAKLEQPELK